MSEKKHIFILGSRGYTNGYGGWETFVKGLIDNWKSENFIFYIYERAENENDTGIKKLKENVFLYRVFVQEKGGFTMMKYDHKCTKITFNYVKEHNIENPIIYYLGLRIGPYIYMKRRAFKKLGAIIIENAAGLEWKRTKWNFLVQIYLWLSAYFMAKASDYLICDSEGILSEYEKMIKGKRPVKLFIPYGTYVNDDLLVERNDKIDTFFVKNNIKEKSYYLIINRFVPENNYELILSEFMSSNTTCDLVLVTNFNKEFKFYQELENKLKFSNDKRIKFVGTIYESNVLEYLRRNSRGYINGHTLGGTNPGLLEAMSTAEVCLVYDVIFARQVGLDCVIYYDKGDQSLVNAIKYCDSLSNKEREHYSDKSKKRMKETYVWSKIVKQYNDFFEGLVK